MDKLYIKPVLACSCLLKSGDKVALDGVYYDGGPNTGIYYDGWPLKSLHKFILHKITDVPPASRIFCFFYREIVSTTSDVVDFWTTTTAGIWGGREATVQASRVGYLAASTNWIFRRDYELK